MTPPAPHNSYYIPTIHMSSCAFQQSPYPEKSLKNTIQRHLFELTSTPIRCFREPFCILTMGRQKITSSQEHTSIFTHRLRAYSWFAVLPNTRAIIVNMKSATGMKPSRSYLFLGGSKTSIMLSQSCWHTMMPVHILHIKTSGVRQLTIFWGLGAVYLSGPQKSCMHSFSHQLGAAFQYPFPFSTDIVTVNFN